MTSRSWFGLAFILVGIAFKFGAVPFHMWLPDVYQGAHDLPVTLFIGTAPKLAALALAILRMLVEGLGDLHCVESGRRMLTVLAVLSLRHRQRRRDRADEHEADAGVLDDRARRLHPSWAMLDRQRRRAYEAALYLYDRPTY